ncbi:MAG: hypothetical protein ACOCXS_00210 [Bacteroidota bacterium]
MEKRIKSILENVKLAQKKGAVKTELFSDNSVSGANEFLFFVKPELTLEDESIKLDEILQLVFDKIEAFGLSIKNIQVLPANYLEEHGLIAKHYGVINRLSSNAKKALSDQAKDIFKDTFGKPTDEANVLGSLEFLKAYPAFSAEALDYLWQNSDFKKMAGGTYVARFSFDSEEVFIVNGFHPRQLEHFTRPGRSIVTFTLVGDTDWRAARHDFIGATNPASAIEGSLRRTFLDKMDYYGIPAVNGSWNGVHLSAGPVEGLVELIRYNSDFSGENEMTPSDYKFGKALIDAFGANITAKILENMDVDFNGNTISVFDLTEEKNSDEALDLLKSALG